jgi:hypothetical protein
MGEFNRAFPRLKADLYAQVALADDVGKRFRYKIPADPEKRREFIRAHGLIVQSAVFRVVGIQKNHRGLLCYRAVCLKYNDDFGRCVDPSVIEFI